MKEGSFDMTICFYQGRFLPARETAIPVTDLAIQRGVGVFDSIRLYGRRAFALREHMDRLESSARGAGIACDGIIADIRDVVREGAKRDDCPDGGDCLAKTYITGGDVNNHGCFPEPRWFVIFESGPAMREEEYREGVALNPTTERRPYPLVKSINYLFGFIPGAGQDDVMECLYCPDGKVTETLRSSFFVCRGGKILTAPIGEVLGGITRNIVVALARENGFAVEERCPTVEELYTADEAFVTSSWKEVLPVVRVGDRKIGNGRPGPVAAHLRKIFRESMERWLDRG